MSEQMDLLVAELPKTRDLIIEAHMRSSHRIAVWYARRNRRQVDDLISAANLGLVQAVQWACEGRLRDSNITPYIASTVHRFCRECIEQDHNIVVDRRAWKKGATVCMVRDAAVEPVEECPVDGALIMAEVLSLFCVRHQTVIELRLAGYKQVEIAERLNVSQPMVFKYLREIKEKLSGMSEACLRIKELL
jgi:RNA polymerase sigma factor (sigma-70 family)